MERSFWSTIRGKLLSRTLVVVLIPVLVIGGVAIAALNSLSSRADDSLTVARAALNDEVVGARVSDASAQIARELALFLDERVADTEDWSTDIGLVNAAKSAAGRAAARELQNLSIEELEAEFADNPRLGDVHVERDLQNSVANTPAFKEIFITDINGFNVDYSNQTSDFVQSDEDWWIQAMENGLDISEVDLDRSTGVFTLDIAVRLEDEGVPVGVLKAGLDVGVVQVIADRFAGGAEAFDVTIVDTAGRFLAETSSGHEPSHIMNQMFLVSSPTTSTPMVRQVFEPNVEALFEEGYRIDDNGVGGFAQVGTELTDLRGMVQQELRAVDWTVVVEQPAAIAFAGIAPLEGLANEVSSTSSTLSLLLLLVAIIGTLAAVGMSLLFAQRITSPIARLRDAAVTAAEVTLPNVVAQIDELEADDELPELEPLVLKTGDEVEDLAHSFNSVQQTAADLASHQARMRRKNVATTFVNLGRRNQNLLSRQLEHINSMESSETNSDTLQRLFQLDHLATRMRRNAESLLVLAGEETPRRFRQPVSMHQLLQAAGGEIEDFGRIELTTLDEAAVEGAAASDIAHLLAELLENASTYSPPGVPIQVHGRRRETGYLLAIVDQGIGMEEDALNAANSRLADPAEFDRAPSAYLGHFVVGHLAKRHGIRVRLADSPYGGVAAQMHLPLSVLSTTQVADRVAVPATPAQTVDVFADSSGDEIGSVEQIEAVTIDEVPDFVPTPAEMAALAPVPEPTEVAVPQETTTPTFQEAAAPEEVRTPDTAPATFEQAAAPQPQPPAATGAAPTAQAEAASAPAEAAGTEDTTPSGFRRRRRGQEGAPQSLSASAPASDASSAPETTPTPSKRTPEQVQASLQAFRQGVETGRAASADPTSTPSYVGDTNEF